MLERTLDSTPQEEAGRFSPSMPYRRDIDGLRAVSILCVVLFHAGLGMLPGGFIGVDVFFVISGFLIAGIIRRKAQEGRFSVLVFWERRARRILPPFVVMTAAVAALSLLLLPPGDMHGFGMQAQAAGLFVSNILFYLQSGYFDAASGSKPLLHTWSLSVEEQFYLMAPLLALLASRLDGRRSTAVLFAAFLVSLGASVYETPRDSSAAFYLLPTRAWELLTGALLAFGAKPRAGNRRLRDAAGLAGLGAIALAALGFSEATPFPGLAALLPCLGAAAVLWSSEGAQGPSLAGRMLSMRPLVLLGLISYALYLWHWPLLVLARYYLLRDPSPGEAAAVIVVAVAVSVVSYRLVEQPVRRRTVLAPRGWLMVAAVGVLALCVGFGTAARETGGFPQRLDAQALRYARAADDRSPDYDRCANLRPEQVERGELCHLGMRTNGQPAFIFWGDSHVDILVVLLRQLTDAFGLNGLQASYASCPPLLEVDVGVPSPGFRCREFNQAVLTTVAAGRIPNVILMARWSAYLTGVVDPTRRDGKPLAISDGVTGGGNRDVFARGLWRTLEALSAVGARVYLVEQIPDALVPVPTALAVNTLLKRPKNLLQPSRAFTEEWQAPVQALLREAEGRYGATVIRTHGRLCDERYCRVERDGEALYMDSHHLSHVGAHFMKEAFEPAFAGIRASVPAEGAPR